MAEVNRILARGFVEGINRGRLDPELYSPDFVYHDPFGQTTDFEGADENIAMFVTGFPDLNVAMEDEVSEGNRVVVRWTARGTHRGEFMGIPPTGNRATWTETHVCRIADGKLVEHWANLDQLGMLQQLGVIPPPEQSEEASPT
jgi:predicted ester cyclase